MKRNFNLFILFFLLMLSSFAQANTKIRFGVGNFYPPFVFSSRSGYVHGFDIDVARAICHQLNAECSFTPMSLSQLFVSLNQNKVDALMGIAIIPSRFSSLDFSRPYFKSTVSYVALANSNFNLNNLTGRRIGAVKGSIFYTYLSKQYGNTIQLMTYDNNQELMAALSDRKIDMALLDSPVANYWVGYSTGLFKTVGNPISINFDHGYGIAVKKGNVALLNSINGALNSITQNGTLDKIKQSYFAK